MSAVNQKRTTVSGLLLLSIPSQYYDARMGKDSAQSRWFTDGPVSFTRQAIDGWVVYARVVADVDDSPVISELRVVPAHVAGAWGDGPPEDWLPTEPRPRVPRGGLGGSLLRRINLHAFLRDPGAFEEWRSWRKAHVPPRVIELKGSTGPVVDAPNVSASPEMDERRKPGRPAEPLEMYADLARDYVLAASRSRTPLNELARTWKMAPSVLRGRVTRARRLGLLEGARPGLPGGVLTDRAHEVLARRGKGKTSTLRRKG
jgi:hypothetical protein